MDIEREKDMGGAGAISKLKDWIASTTTQTAEIGLDTHLIREGFLDSLQMVNFLLYIEEIRGREIPEALLQPEHFASLRKIHETFFVG
jgi:acyl carrier protein